MDKNDRDLRELVFGDELARTPEAELQAINERPESQAELNRLLELRETLLSLADEEPPRRTVLVSETAGAPWWKRVLSPGSPGWGFAGALALAAAVLAHGYLARSVERNSAALALESPRIAATAATPAVPGEEAIDARIEDAVERRLAREIHAVKAELRKEYQGETRRLVAAAEERMEQRRENEMFQMREAVAFIQKKYGRQLVANVAYMGERQ